MKGTLILIVLFLMIPVFAFAIDLPKTPDSSGIVAMIKRPEEPCNAADFFRRAEDAYRPELEKKREDRSIIAKDHPALDLVLKGIKCKTCEFPYSKEMTIPPTEQLIPMAALYWAVAGRLAQDGRALFEEKKFDQSRELFSNAVILGLLLYEENGITFLQDMISLRVISEGAKGLGDLAIAEDNKDAARVYATFVEQSQLYIEGISRFIREQLTYEALLRDPNSQSAHIRKLVDLYKTVDNPRIRLEFLLFTGLAKPLITDPDAIREIDSLVTETLSDPDIRFQRMGNWIKSLDEKSATKELKEMIGSTLP